MYFTFLHAGINNNRQTLSNVESDSEPLKLNIRMKFMADWNFIAGD